MQFSLAILAAFIGLAVAGPSEEYVPYNFELGRRCVLCNPPGSGDNECCFQKSACYTPGCNE
jgi:hypothetical protein